MSQLVYAGFHTIHSLHYKFVLIDLKVHNVWNTMLITLKSLRYTIQMAVFVMFFFGYIKVCFEILIKLYDCLYFIHLQKTSTTNYHINITYRAACPK